MSQKPKGLGFILFANLLPLLLFVGILSSGFIPIVWYGKVPLLLFETYFLPPLIYRLLPRQRAEGRFQMQDPAFKIWWIGTQLQILYLRFAFLEEALRLIPFAYSAWLRLWGARIGKSIYWAPGVIILDRPYLNMGDRIIVGYGAGFTSHHFIHTRETTELLLAKTFIEDEAIVGGEARLGPGTRVCKREMLPTTVGLAPFFEWRGGRKRAIQSPNEDKNYPNG